ncbi:hypothetical protein SDC9_71669 [bioreactor metagenome]|uniref:Uncharacterized protein n=1 Tax=bioreactor metagenome TaxID=1076179 RepID=A0A644YA37_9ZZZZ
MRDVGAFPECVVHTQDVVLKVSDFVIHEVDQRDRLSISERLLKFHFFSGVHCFPEFTP